MNPYRSGIRQEAPEEEVENSTDCIAHGCPLPGVFRIKLHGPSPSICRAHDATPAHEWPAITERVKHLERALFASLDMTNGTAGDRPEPNMVAKFVALSPDLAPAGNPSLRTYGAFVYGKLIEKVRPKTIYPPSHGDGGGLMRVDIRL